MSEGRQETRSDSSNLDQFIESLWTSFFTCKMKSLDLRITRSLSTYYHNSLKTNRGMEKEKKNKKVKERDEETSQNKQGKKRRKEKKQMSLLKMRFLNPWVIPVSNQLNLANVQLHGLPHVHCVSANIMSLFLLIEFVFSVINIIIIPN